MKNFGLRLKKLREREGVSIQALSKEVKANILMIRDWEKGKMVLTVVHLVRIAQYFGVSVDYLVGL